MALVILMSYVTRTVSFASSNSSFVRPSMYIQNCFDLFMPLRTYIAREPPIEIEFCFMIQPFAIEELQLDDSCS